MFHMATVGRMDNLRVRHNDSIPKKPISRWKPRKDLWNVEFTCVSQIKSRELRRKVVSQIIKYQCVFFFDNVLEKCIILTCSVNATAVRNGWRNERFRIKLPTTKRQTENAIRKSKMSKRMWSLRVYTTKYRDNEITKMCEPVRAVRLANGKLITRFDY